MISHSRFRLAELRVAIFFEMLASLPVVRLLTDVLGNHKDLFDEAPFVLPGEPEGPVRLSPDAPRIEFRSKTGKWRMQIALVRADVFLSLGAEEDVLTTAMIFESCSPILDEVAEVLRAPIWRLGAVCERFSLDDDPGAAISKFFCKNQWTENNGPLAELQSFELHARQIRELSGTKVNTWVRCKTGRVSGVTEGPAIILQQDINTLAEDKSKVYAVAERSRFFHAAAQEIDRLNVLYFPETEPQ